MFVDLHLHTTASDGSYTPEEIVDRALEAGLKAIAITDHDTTAGVLPAIEAGQRAGLEVLPGVELSTDAAGQEVHILGYLMDLKDHDFQETLGRLGASRHGRMGKMVEKLQVMGMKVSLQDVQRVAGAGANLGRPHVARVLVDKGYISSISQAFEEYLGMGKPAHVPRYKITPEEAISLIKGAKGIPVLAHPGLLKEAREIIEGLIRVGLLGLEAYHSDHDEDTTARFLALAGDKGLLVTGGSDCHGPRFKGLPLMGTIKAPYILVEKLKAKHLYL